MKLFLGIASIMFITPINGWNLLRHKDVAPPQKVNLMQHHDGSVHLFSMNKYAVGMLGAEIPLPRTTTVDSKYTVTL
jgi:hypothetical protein